MASTPREGVNHIDCRLPEQRWVHHVTLKPDGIDAITYALRTQVEQLELLSKQLKKAEKMEFKVGNFYKTVDQSPQGPTFIQVITADQYNVQGVGFRAGLYSPCMLISTSHIHRWEEMYIPEVGSEMEFSGGRRRKFLAMNAMVRKPYVFFIAGLDRNLSVGIEDVNPPVKTLFVNSILETFTEENPNLDVWFVFKHKVSIKSTKLGLIPANKLGEDEHASEIYKTEQGAKDYIVKNIDKLF